MEAYRVGSLFLRLAFYIVTGVLLSSITWSVISHSTVTGDYLLASVLLVMMFYVVGQFCVDRWRPETETDDFHDVKPWKTPRATTVAGLWLRVGFSTLVNVSIYAILASVLVLTTTAEVAFMALLGTLFLLRVPHLYWSMRSRYRQASDGELTALSGRRLIYHKGSRLNRRARWFCICISPLRSCIGIPSYRSPETRQAE